MISLSGLKWGKLIGEQGHVIMVERIYAVTAVPLGNDYYFRAYVGAYNIRNNERVYVNVVIKNYTINDIYYLINDKSIDKIGIEIDDAVYECKVEWHGDALIILFPTEHSEDIDEYWTKWEKVYYRISGIKNEYAATKVLENELERLNNFIWYAEYLLEYKDENKAPIESVTKADGIYLKYLMDYEFAVCFMDDSADLEQFLKDMLLDVQALKEFIGIEKE